MKKIIALLLTCLMAVSLAACTYSIHDKEKKAGAGEGTENVTEAETAAEEEIAAEAETGTRIPNPYVDYETLEDACEAAGVSLKLPDSIEGYERTDYQAIDGEMVNVIYTAADGSMLLIRKAKGSGDISGDYNQYENDSEQTVNDIDVQVRGNGHTLSTAVWYDNGEAYALTMDSPMEMDRGLELLQQLIDLNTIFDEDGPEEP